MEVFLLPFRMWRLVRNEGVDIYCVVANHSASALNLDHQHLFSMATAALSPNGQLFNERVVSLVRGHSTI